MKRLFSIIVILMLFVSATLAQSNEVPKTFPGEVIKSKFGYPKSYEGPKDISYQVSLIAEMFGLEPMEALSYAKNLPALPAGAEGWFAIPKISAVARVNFPGVTDVDEQYRISLAIVFGAIDGNRPFKNYLDEKLPFSNINISWRTLKYVQKLEETQAGDILIIAAQHGMLHRGESPRMSSEILADNEFGLSTFALACMALTHPERHSKANKLYVNCIGDEYITQLKDESFASPVILYYNDETELDFNPADAALSHCGAGTGFIPYGPNIISVTPGM